jgi:hypothetical protein
MINNHSFDFDDKILIINNVDDIREVSKYAKDKVEKKVLSDFYVAKTIEKEVLSFFNLKREDFKASEGYEDKWVFYNAICVLTAIYLCKTDYFLYHTGDSYLEKKINWISETIDFMERKKNIKVANLVWNNNYDEVAKESYKKKGSFFIAKEGFSDQLFLVKTNDFKKRIYNEIRGDSSHFPRGDVFERRVFSFMKNHKWKRIIYSKGSYTHESF